jgi:hypothetical protein
MFGAYGDVVCIKILKNKRDCALVQMAKPHHAQQVGNYLADGQATLRLACSAYLVFSVLNLIFQLCSLSHFSSKALL